MARLIASFACLCMCLGLTAACGERTSASESKEAEPDGPATVTVTASPQTGPTPESTPTKAPATTRPATPRPATPRPATPKPAPVDLSGYDVPGFSTPSGNIGCLFDDYDGAHVRCDRLAMAGPPSAKPADCDFDWGHSVELSAGGRAALACTSDSVMGIQGETDGTRALPYGDSVRFMGITCTSTRNGLRCQTSGGHGFLVSRATIRVR